MNLQKQRTIEVVVDTAISVFAKGLISRYSDEVDDINGVINMNKNNCFIAELGEEFMFYSAFVRFFDSSFGNVLEKMGNNIAKLSYEVRNNLVKLQPKDLIGDFQRILKPNGNIFIFCSYNIIGEYHKVFDPEFDTFQFMVWHKTNPVPNFRKSSFLNSRELIVSCWNKGHTWNFTNQRDMHNFIESGICMGAERVKDENGKTYIQLNNSFYKQKDRTLWYGLKITWGKKIFITLFFLILF